MPSPSPLIRRVLLLLALSLALGTRERASAARPNIIVILVDDMGYSDVGAFGGEIRTPHLDRLAREGLRFTQFYNTAKCYTTRASLLTGLYQHESGLGYNAWRPMRNAVTVAEVLREAGYRTWFSGKWHLGEPPSKRGFDRTFGFISQGILNSYFEPWLDGPDERLGVSRWDVDGKILEAYRPEQPGFYATDAFTGRAIDWIRETRAGETPFFLYLAYNAPHWPLQAPPEDIAKYRQLYRAGWDELRRARHQRQISLGIIPPGTALPPRAAGVPAWRDVPDQEEQAALMAVHAAMVDRIDQNVGRILAALRDQGLERNTLVLFLSDNGADKAGFRRRPENAIGSSRSFDAVGRGWANMGNTPWQRFKGESIEGGISTPLIAWWPEGIRNPGRINHEAMGHVVDIMATSVDAASARYPGVFNGEKIHPMRGLSLLPVFRAERETLHDTLFFEWAKSRAVRQGRWKLFWPNDPAAFRDGKPHWQLYDTLLDRVELHDVAGLHPDRVREMKAAWEAWAREVGVAGFSPAASANNSAAGNDPP